MAASTRSPRSGCRTRRTPRSSSPSRTPRPQGLGLSGGSRDVGPLEPVGSGEPLLYRRRSDREQLARSVTIAIVSSIVVFGGLALIITNSPGWESVKQSFLDPEVFADSLPDVVAAFWVNIRLFLVAEVFILVFGLLLAVVRALPGPA